MVIMSPQLFSYKLLVTMGEWGEDKRSIRFSPQQEITCFGCVHTTSIDNNRLLTVKSPDNYLCCPKAENQHNQTSHGLCTGGSWCKDHLTCDQPEILRHLRSHVKFLRAISFKSKWLMITA